ncbi:sugar phosphate isomerase/epimerase family protein [Streptomyces sp. NPDC051561]|uniref:sugar phosphate isomerase/epimerase family protein n=1 Tax=Streptomyces sp. NPDC051561 TaxID=3365658 RepID=UPI00379F7FD6
MTEAVRGVPQGPPRSGRLTHIKVGSAPDSWGVWFPQDPVQVPWRRFLDEVAGSGYEWIELGPYGYLPSDPALLGRELAARGLRVSAGTVFTALHHGGASAWERTWAHVSQVATHAQAVGAGHLVMIPAFWRDDRTGEPLEGATLTAGQWRTLAAQTERLSRQVHEEFGLRVVVHPHADTHIDTEENVVRLLHATDPDLVHLCLDTGHYAYCGGDSVKLIERYGERIGYLHLKQVDPALLARVRERDLPFGPAVGLGVMCEPPAGEPAWEPVLEAAQALGRRRGVELFAIVEQDMYPCPPEKPLPIARRTRSFLRSCGA